MLPVVTIEDINQLLAQIGLQRFFCELISCLHQDFADWHSFIKTPRLATHLPQGVLELMPICGRDYYAFKYVNGHPSNPKQHKQTVVALGLLADVHTGYPLLVSEMTLLTALRTAATSALAARFMARKAAQQMAIIGTGAQSEFQVLALHYELGINRVKYYDVDPQAMHKFANNLTSFDLQLIPCTDVQSALLGSEVIITATAAKLQAKILLDEWIQPGMHINAIGGDCPQKTELDPDIVKRSKIVVEYLAQTRYEGEMQHHAGLPIHAELWELAMGTKQGRNSAEEITLFDSVGFALEDYSILRYVYQLVQQYAICHPLSLIPEITDPKNLFGVLLTESDRRCV